MKKTAVNLDKLFLRHIKRLRPTDSLGKQQAWARALTRNLDDRLFDDLGRHLPKSKEVFSNHQWEQNFGNFQRRGARPKVNDRVKILEELRRMEREDLQYLVRPEDWKKLTSPDYIPPPPTGGPRVPPLPPLPPIDSKKIRNFLGAAIGGTALAGLAGLGFYKRKQKKVKDSIDNMFNKNK